MAATDASAWRTVRVFVSSTFKDMQAERDHLVRFVFPRLREELLPRRIHLVDVDLRWGVTSDQNALEVCREIIDECRPRFLCILGGRYGWVPPGKVHSITADEVHYGVLDRLLNERGFAYFYFRSETATGAMPGIPGEFREQPGSNNEAKLAELKQAIIAAGLNPFTYPAHWDNDTQRLTGLALFGNRVHDDLLRGIDEEFGVHVPEPFDEFDEERASMAAFIEERNQHFVLGSRDAALNELIAHVTTPGGNGYICVTGVPGSGKSALLAHLTSLASLRAQHSTLVIAHFVGATSGSTDVRRTLRRLCHELQTNALDIPDDFDKLCALFSELLRSTCARRRVVILLDGVDQFEF